MANIQQERPHDEQTPLQKRAPPQQQRVTSWYKYLTFESSSNFDYILICFFVLLEIVFGYVIIQKIPYTEIDYVAYMEQVHTFIHDKERDYYNIRGNTGPLVYPAGFLYIYSIIQYITQYHLDIDTNDAIDATHSQNEHAIRITQYIFLFFYCFTQLFVFLIYYHSTIRTLQQLQQKQQQVENTSSSSSSSTTTTTAIGRQIWLCRCLYVVLCLSKRVHSIYVLRLFNDGITMFFFYISLYCMIRNQWNIGCIFFSIAVSIKMNILLYAPGLLLLLLHVSNNLYHVIYRIFIFCAVPQLIFGLPFLLHHPIHYIHKAFEFDRTFFYIWTVNWKVCSGTCGPLCIVSIYFRFYFGFLTDYHATLCQTLSLILLFFYTE
jgi:alpha-1,3-mannosyltransferase